MISNMLPLRVLGLSLLTGLAFAAGAPLFGGKQLVAALQRGGYVILMRHASSPGSPPDPAQADVENIQHERQLDAGGRASAQAMGEAIRRLRIPVGEVLSSPTYRALETARVAQLPSPRTFDELGEAGKNMGRDKGGPRGAWIRSLVSRGPKLGTNTVIITHYPNITEAFADQATDLAEGEALIFRPDGRGGALLVGRVKIDDWPKLTAAGTE
jgi:phosphohistidine phosphatase SixA